VVILPSSVCGFGITKNNEYILYSSISKIPNNCDEFLKYWVHNIHVKIKKESYYFLLGFHDGYGEYIPYYLYDLIPYTAKNTEFENKETIKNDSNMLVPILHKNKDVFCYSKRINDKYAIAVPDFFFTQSNGYRTAPKEYLNDIDKNFVLFTEKKNECIFRGKADNGSVNNFKNPRDKDNLNHRQYLKRLYNENKLQNINVDDDFMSPVEQLKYKYLLVMDGWSNAWDSTVWKLYSGSVVLIVDSVWEQWYVRQIIPWVHYVPVHNDLSNLNVMIQWCIDNDDLCHQISINSKQFITDNLNFDTVTENFSNHMSAYFSTK
jgi:hypothetical protein